MFLNNLLIKPFDMKKNLQLSSFYKFLIKFIINHLQRKNLIAPWTIRLMQLIPIEENLFIFVKISLLNVEKTCCFFSIGMLFQFPFLLCKLINSTLSHNSKGNAQFKTCVRNIRASEPMKMALTYYLQNNSS